MTAEASNTSPVLLDSREALKKVKFLKVYAPVGISVTLAVWLGSLAVTAKYSDPYNYSLFPAITALLIIGSVVSFFWFMLERELRAVTRNTEYSANAAIAQLLENKYSIRLRETVKFYSNPFVSRHSLNYISVSKDPLSAIDLQTGKPTRVILTLSADLKDVEAAILPVAPATK